MPGQQAVDAPRSSLFQVRPEDLFIITDKKHPRYDKRVELPLDEGLAASVHASGVIEPIIAWKDGDRIEVLDGRQRTRAAVESNKTRKKTGATLLRVPVVLRKIADDAVATSIRNQANIRVPDTILAKAESVKHDMEIHGKSESQAAAERGVGVATVKQWLRLLDCSAKVRAAVDEGRITLTHAVTHLAKLRREDQDAALAELVQHRGGAARGPNKGSSTKATGKTKTGRPSIQVIKAIARHEYAEPLDPQLRAFVDYVTGGLDQDALIERVPALAPAFAPRTEAAE